MRHLTKRLAILTTAGSLAITAASATTWWILRGQDTPTRPPTPVSKIDTYQRACLFISPDADTTTTSHVWAGMQQAVAHRPSLLIQRYTVPTAVTAKTYLNTLTQMRCTTIITIGTATRDATAATPHSNHFIVVTRHPVTAPHTTSLSPAQATPDTISAALSAL